MTNVNPGETPTSTETRRGEPASAPSRLRILVAIASYGEGHLHFLENIIATYRRFPWDIDIVVTSDAEKRGLEGVEWRIGLPSPNPWTLPFAHKEVFAERADRYDLFIYSEDDIGITEATIPAFLRATECLHDDEIAGFMRYEIDGRGQRMMAEPWGRYHWKPDSVRRRGVRVFAEFTNEHAGFYILTKDQLKRAIASGGFLRGPYRGRYNWPETAATDPYTNCGFSKVICLSEFDDFLVHHLPNRYADGLPVSLTAFKEQINVLLAIERGDHPVASLCKVEANVRASWGKKSFYERPHRSVVEAVPTEIKTALSIGCGWGALEEQLIAKNIAVTAFPLDSVIGATAQRRGVEIIPGTLQECFGAIRGRTFDCIIVTHLLHLQPDPESFSKRCIEFLAPLGYLVFNGPNLQRLPITLAGLLSSDGIRIDEPYEKSGINRVIPDDLAKVLNTCGLENWEVRWFNHSIEKFGLKKFQISAGRLTAREWVMRAQFVPGLLEN